MIFSIVFCHKQEMVEFIFLLQINNFFKRVKKKACFISHTDLCFEAMKFYAWLLFISFTYYWYRNLMQYIEAINWKLFIKLIDF